MTKFSIRERVEALGRLTGSSRNIGPQFGSELRWALRGVRARGWTAAFSIGLLALAIAANGIVFSVADSLMFNVTPYPDSSQLVRIVEAAQPNRAGLRPDYFRQLVARPGPLGVLAGYSQSTVFLTGEDTPERVSIVNATPELFEALRWAPRWGRAFTAADVQAPDTDAVVISETLAVARFGDPAAAVGRVLETTEVPLTVVGVMPKAFRFPTGRVDIWRGFTVHSPLAATIFSVTPLARLRDDQDLESVATLLRDSLADKTADGQQQFVPATQPYSRPRADTTQFWALLGAAACLLLAACANTASVELAASLARTRVYAIQRSLGASRWLLARGALIEGGLIVSAAAVLGTAWAATGVGLLGAQLPNVYSTVPANPIDLDARVIAFMIGISSIVWCATTMPVVLLASGTRLSDVLRRSSQVFAGSTRAAWSRRILTVAQLALTVPLLIGSVLYARTYLSRLDVEKGFDSTNLASLSLTVPPQMMDQMASATDALVDRLGSSPGVVAIMPDRPPQDADSPFGLERIEIDGTWRSVANLRVAQKFVSVNYHEVLRNRLREGRYLSADDSSQQVIVDTLFADRFWPGGAVGHSFRRSENDPSFVVVGVVDHVRTAQERLTGSTSDSLLFYLSRRALPALPIPTPRPRTSGRRVGGPTSAFIALTMRLDSPARLPDVLAVVRSEVPQFAVRASMVNDDYAEWEAEVLLQTQVITAFGVLAFLMAIAGVYGVMAFLVASRTRELGVRMALGASQRDVVTLILGSATRLTVIGTALGLAGAVALARYVESELFGVSPTDTVTYVFVALVVITGGTLATWQPTRQAARVDPAITLRAE